MNALATITRVSGWQDCRVPTARERLAAYRAQLHNRDDFDPLAHAAQIAHGVAWLDAFRRRATTQGEHP